MRSGENHAIGDAANAFLLAIEISVQEKEELRLRSPKFLRGRCHTVHVAEQAKQMLVESIRYHSQVCTIFRELAIGDALNVM